MALLRRLLSLAVAVLGVAAYYAYTNYWFYLPGLISYFTMTVHPHRPSNWERQLLSEIPPVRSKEERIKKPNVIFIVADDLGYNDISFYGGGIEGLPTRHIDSIGGAGAGFTSGYAGHATCAPSRAAIMTGRYATRFGFEFTPVPLAMSKVLGASEPGQLHENIYFKEREKSVPGMAAMTFPLAERTIAEHMQSAGYHSMLVGKWHLGHSPGHRPEQRGFDEMLGFNLGASMYMPRSHPDVQEHRLEGDFPDRFLWANLRYFVCESNTTHNSNFAPNEYMTDYLGKQAAHAVAANRHRPFFMYLAFNAPHTPLQALRADYDSLSHIKSHNHRVYAAMIKSLDRSIGYVLDAVREAGLEEDTLIVFTSDNGGANYVDIRDINKPYRGWKGTMFEGGLKVPYLMKWPRRIRAGSIYTYPVGHVDMFATAAASAGATSGAAALDGVDLLPFLEAGNDTIDSAEDFLMPHNTFYWRSGHYKALLYKNKWKLQISEIPKKMWLFDMLNDPIEHNNLAENEAYTEVLQMLLSIVDKEDSQQASPMWPAMSATYVPIDKTWNDPQLPEDEFILWEN